METNPKNGSYMTPETRAASLRQYEPYKPSINDDESIELLFKDSFLGRIKMVDCDWESNHIDDETIVNTYRYLIENQDNQTLAKYNYDLVLLMAYSGLRKVENDLHFFEDMKPYKDEDNEFYDVGYNLNKVKTTIQSSKKDLKPDKIEFFIKTVEKSRDKTFEADLIKDDVKSVAIKIACYCFALLTATVKQENAVQNVLMKIDDYVNNRFYNKPTMFKMSENKLKMDFVMRFGLAVQQTPMVNNLIYHAFKTTMKGDPRTQNLINALVMTRICKHGLPVYTLAAPLATLNCEADNRVSIMRILRLGLNIVTLPSIENFYAFQILVEMPYSEYTKLSTKTKERFKREEGDVKYWPIARALNTSWLVALGRRLNPDLINFLFHLNKNFGLISEAGSEFNLPKTRLKFVEEWAESAAQVLRDDLNPTHLMDSKVLEAYNNLKRKSERAISDIDE